MSTSDKKAAVMTVKCESDNAKTGVVTASGNTPGTHPDEQIYSAIMSTEVSRFGNAGYTGSPDDDFEGIEKLEIELGDRQFIERIIALGADGHEHGIALTDDVAYEFTSDLENQVHIPHGIAALLDAEGMKDVKLFHNHPNGTAPSAVDLSQLLRKRTAKIYVVGNNGNLHLIDASKGEIPSTAEFDEIRNQLAREIDSMIYAETTSGDMTIEMGNYIFAKEQAYRIAMHFGWEYTGGQIDEIL